MRKTISFLSLAALLLGMHALPAHAATVLPLSQVHSGDLVRGTTFSAVYYLGRDGFRYVFPNDKTYFTWYTDFNSVKFVSDTDLATIQIGGNVTYKPGSRLIKINSDPKVYAVDHGTAGAKRRFITSEAVAIAIYGANWNKMIDDVPDAFFSNYREVGADIEQAGDFNPSAVTSSVSDINDDKSLKVPTLVDIQDNQFAPATITITAGTAIKFTNKGANPHTATSEDLSWGTGTLQAGQNFSRYFKTAGSYPFHCSVNPSMTGTVIVE